MATSPASTVGARGCSPASSSVLACRASLAQTARTLCNLDAWCKLLLTLDGRDKVTKVLQYVCRFLAYWYSGRRSTHAAERFHAFKTSLGTSRKAFRLGRSLIEWNKLRELFQQLLESSGWVFQPCGKSGSAAPLWNLVGTSLKTAGLWGFWAADNVSFLAQGGLLDDYSYATPTRLNLRHQIVTKASAWANQSYFFGAVAGFVTNWQAYWEHRSHTSALAAVNDASDNDTVGSSPSDVLQRAYEKQWTLFLSLVKSTCDVLVFSNNPGVDLWKKYRNGRPMHEGFHCLCGLGSASTVLYANYPASK